MQSKPVYSLVRADGRASIECYKPEDGYIVGDWYKFGDGKYQMRQFKDSKEWAAKVL